MSKSKSWREFVRFLLLAQAASDAGKGIPSSKGSQSLKARKYEYAAKSDYISQAIVWGKRVPRVRVGGSNGIVLFSIEGVGQVSFHVWEGEEVGLSPAADWDGQRGGSRRTCRKLAQMTQMGHLYRVRGAK